MRGDVLHYDEVQGFGFITGADGNQYTFAREDVRHAQAKVPGAAVEFQPKGGQAKLIVAASVPAQPAAPPAAFSSSVSTAEEPTLLDPVPPAPTAPPVRPTGLPPVIAPRQAPPPPTLSPDYRGYPPPGTGLWHYFWQCLTANYVNFRGRARRKEYWAFVLFGSIAFVALFCLGLLLDLTAGNVNWNNSQMIFTWALPVLWLLATILPGIAVTVRRQHDIGISGWFYLLVLVPSVGGLIILVFTLISSQKHDNKWGPVPDGILWPPYYPPQPTT